MQFPKDLDSRLLLHNLKHNPQTHMGSLVTYRDFMAKPLMLCFKHLDIKRLTSRDNHLMNDLKHMDNLPVCHGARDKREMVFLELKYQQMACIKSMDNIKAQLLDTFLQYTIWDVRPLSVSRHISSRTKI